MSLVVTTALGKIVLRLRADAAPVEQATHIVWSSRATVFLAGAGFSRYRLCCVDAVFSGTSIKNPHPPLSVNETRLTNRRGTASVAHWDVPDCGNSEWFINLQDSPHLDSAYGGYCVFAEVAEDDAASWATIGQSPRPFRQARNLLYFGAKFAE